MTKPDPYPEILAVLKCTETFAEALLKPVNRAPFQDTDRAKLTMVFPGLAHEYWVATRSISSTTSPERRWRWRSI
jgi:hypothetical protein